MQSISGHTLNYSETAYKKFPNIKFVIFTRDPISRIISGYRGWSRRNTSVPFKEWVMKLHGSPRFHNRQTNFICGSDNIEEAKNILRNKYFFAGSIDVFDSSLLLLQKMLDNNFDVRYQRLRVSSESKEEILDDPLNKDILDRLRENNFLDFELNEYIKKDLCCMLSEKYGHVMDKDIKIFRKNNENYTFNRTKLYTFKIFKYFFLNTFLRFCT